MAGANPAVNTPRPSRGTRIESCDFFCLDWLSLILLVCFILLGLACRVGAMGYTRYVCFLCPTCRLRRLEPYLFLFFFISYYRVCVEFSVCVVFSSHSFWTSMDVPAVVTQEEGNTGFSIHLLSAVLAFIFLARRIQPFLSLVDREVEFCVLTI